MPAKPMNNAYGQLVCFVLDDEALRMKVAEEAGRRIDKTFQATCAKLNITGATPLVGSPLLIVATGQAERGVA